MGKRKTRKVCKKHVNFTKSEGEIKNCLQNNGVNLLFCENGERN